MSEINLKLKTYDELTFEISRLNTDKYLLEQKLQQKEDIIKEVLFDLHETRKINAKCHSLKDNKGNLFILIDIDHLDYLINILEGDKLD